MRRAPRQRLGKMECLLDTPVHDHFDETVAGCLGHRAVSLRNDSRCREGCCWEYRLASSTSGYPLNTAFQCVFLSTVVKFRGQSSASRIEALASQQSAMAATDHRVRQFRQSCGDPASDAGPDR